MGLSIHDLLRAKNLLALCLAVLFGIAAVGQPPRTLRAEITNVQIVGTHTNPEDENDLIVSVRVTIRALDQSVVVPNCAEKDSPPFFCVAQITRRKGKVVPVRKLLMATMGVPSEDQWKPLLIQPGSQQALDFAYSTALMDVSPAEPLRVKLQIWPDAKSMSDWKASTSLLTPIFKNPSKAR